jgi:Zn-dependent peptidase ImmA (M78 family)
MASIRFTNYEGQKYEIKIRKPRKEVGADGLCYPPQDGGRAKILINPHQDDDDYNETIIHELSHAFFWGTDEEKITLFAKQLTKILKKFGRGRNEGNIY